MHYFALILLSFTSLVLAIIAKAMGKVLHYTYPPTVHGSGLGEVDPIWLILVQLVLVVLILLKSIFGLYILGGVVLVMTIDLYPLWHIVGGQDLGLQLQTTIVVIFWLMLGTGWGSYRHFMK